MGEVMTFDEILADKTYQSEFDKRLTKALETDRTNRETERKAATEKERAEMLAKLGVKDDTELEATLTYLAEKRQADAQAEADKPEIERIKGELETLKTASGESKALAESQAKELDALRLEKAVREKGLSGDSAELAVFRIEKLVASGKTVAEAAEEYFTANPPPEPKEPKPPQPPTPEFVPSSTATNVTPSEADSLKAQFEEAKKLRDTAKISMLTRIASEKNIKLE